jgi:hypothetical protein
MFCTWPSNRMHAGAPGISSKSLPARATNVASHLFSRAVAHELSLGSAATALISGD